MPLKLVRSDSNARLWGACVTRFLDELGGEDGPLGHPSHLWIAHRAQRDLLLEAAEERGLAGWLSPPFSFLSELPERFGISRRPIGPLTGRLLVSRIATRVGRTHGFAGDAGEETPGRGHMVDRALSELLPEGVDPESLGGALGALVADDFERRRNAWLLESHAAYLAHLEEAGQFDPRSIHALVAAEVAGGGLPDALGGATRLHVYGVTSLRGRTKLFEALANQPSCDVVVYLPLEPAGSEWDALAGETEILRPQPRRRTVEVQPAPDAVREAEWVAIRIKRMLVDGEAEPHEIAVVARSGREDTRRIHDALGRIGVPSTARLRSRLHEVPAVRALLQLFSAAADEWPWGGLRAVLGSPYFGRDVDLRPLDVLASRSRPRGLAEWRDGLRSLEEEAASARGWVIRRAGITGPSLERAAAELERVAGEVDGLFTPRTETEWIETTRSLLRGDPLGLRDAVNRVVDDRWDIVRLDQRALLALDGLLREWAELVADASREIGIGEWYARLRRLLESNEIAISNPSKRGVQVLEAHEAAGTPFRKVFLIHANEGVFPPKPGGGLFTEAEREALASGGLPLSTRDLAFERERRLWLACVGSESVTVTYRTSDARGIPRLASLFVPAHDRSTELARTRRELPAADDDDGAPGPVTRAGLLESELARFLRVRRSGRACAFTTPAPHAIRAAALRAFVEELRSGGLDDAAQRHATEALAEAASRSDGTADGLDPAALFGNQRPLSQRPGPWNGELRDPALLALLAGRYSATHEWSASQLEQYGRRPFDFLLERVLGLRQVEVVEDEASRLTIGGLVHSILETFYRDRLGRPSEPFDEEAREALDRAFESACREFEESERQWVGLPHVWAATREELRERLFEFVEWEFTRRKPGTPLGVEFSFGRGAPRAAVDLAGPGCDGAELPLLLGGRIDRIDRLEGDALRVVDYKSGRSGPSPRAFEDGAALQATLYMAAVQAAGLGTAAVGSYRTVRAPADRAKRSAADVGPSVAFAREIAARVRAGLFEAVQACSVDVSDWQPGRAIARSTAQIDSGTRFDTLAPMPPPGGIPRAPAPAPAEVE